MARRAGPKRETLSLRQKYKLWRNSGITPREFNELHHLLKMPVRLLYTHPNYKQRINAVAIFGMQVLNVDELQWTAMRHLLNALGDKHHEVVKAAATEIETQIANAQERRTHQKLESLLSEVGVEKLEDAFNKHRDQETRLQILHALGEIGRAYRDADVEQPLSNAARSIDKTISNAANTHLQAIRRIRGGQ